MKHIMIYFFENVIFQEQTKSFLSLFTCYSQLKRFERMSEIFLTVLQITNFICDFLRNLVPFVQFKKCEKHPWRSVTKSNTPPLVFFTF